jgi:hypothetical protein
MAAAKLLLGLRVNRGRSQWVWRAIIVTELAMTGFGVLWLAHRRSGSPCSACQALSCRWQLSCA